MPETQEDKLSGLERVGIDDARPTLGEYVLRAGYGKERIIVTRMGRDCCALVPMSDLERLMGEVA